MELVIIKTLKEITFELTNYCPHSCKYCSSNITNKFNEAIFLYPTIIYNILKNKHYDVIIISGGEPLSHPNFYNIIEKCKLHTNDVLVYTNTFSHICFNANVIDNV